MHRWHPIMCCRCSPAAGPPEPQSTPSRLPLAALAAVSQWPKSLSSLPSGHAQGVFGASCGKFPPKLRPLKLERRRARESGNSAATMCPRAAEQIYRCLEALGRRVARPQTVAILAQPWLGATGMQSKDRLFSALVIVLGAVSTALLVFVIFSL